MLASDAASLCTTVAVFVEKTEGLSVFFDLFWSEAVRLRIVVVIALQYGVVHGRGISGRTGALCHSGSLDRCNDGQLAARLQVAKRNLALLQLKHPRKCLCFLHNSYSLVSPLPGAREEQHAAV